MLRFGSALPWSVQCAVHASQATLHKLSRSHVSEAHTIQRLQLARNVCSQNLLRRAHVYQALRHGLDTSQLSIRKYSATPGAVHSDPSHHEDACPPLETGLYLVGTPIGNLEDISLRALRILRTATVVLAEDTRHSRKLLNHFNITAQLYSFHQHNESSKEKVVLTMLQAE